MPRLIAVAALVLLLTPLTTAQAPQRRTVWDGVYAPAQARAGEARFAANCTGCHREDLAGGGDANGDAPALAGPGFMNDHEGATLDTLFSFMKGNMPPDNRGGLTDDEYAAIIAYLLEANGFPAGEMPLPATADALRGVRIEPHGGLQPPPNFAVVQVVACLVSRNGQWLATRASDPIRARVALDPAAEPLGAAEFHLLDVSGTPAVGIKTLVTGILIQDPAGNRLNVTALRSVGSSC